MTRRRDRQLSRGQDPHDRKVRAIAKQYKDLGYDVKADLPTYDKPDPIGKGSHIPDVHAKNWWGDEVIVEVDTPGTEDSDQLSTFRRSASQRGAEFRHEIVRPRGMKKTYASKRVVKSSGKPSSIRRTQIRKAVGKVSRAVSKKR